MLLCTSARATSKRQKQSIMKALVLSLCLLFCGSCFTQEPLAIKTSLKVIDQSDLAVVFDLTSSEDTVIPTAELPWFVPTDLTFIVVPVGAGAALQRFYVPQSPVAGDSTLKKGLSISGELRLAVFFPDLIGENAKSDLILFWHWDHRETKLANDGRQGYGGWLHIPKNFVQDGKQK
jgi:hypothetical protein